MGRRRAARDRELAFFGTSAAAARERKKVAAEADEAWRTGVVKARHGVDGHLKLTINVQKAKEAEELRAAEERRRGPQVITLKDNSQRAQDQRAERDYIDHLKGKDRSNGTARPGRRAA